MAFNDADEPAVDQRFQIDIHDSSSRVVHSHATIETVPAHGAITVPIDLPRLRRDLYLASLRIGDGVDWRGVVSFTVGAR